MISSRTKTVNSSQTKTVSSLSRQLRLLLGCLPPTALLPTCWFRIRWPVGSAISRCNRSVGRDRPTVRRLGARPVFRGWEPVGCLRPARLGSQSSNRTYADTGKQRNRANPSGRWGSLARLQPCPLTAHYLHSGQVLIRLLPILNCPTQLRGGVLVAPAKISTPATAPALQRLISTPAADQ